MSKRQLNVRIDADDYEILEALAFVERTSVGQLALDVLQGHLEDRGDTEAVRLAMQAREVYDAENEGVLRRLSEKQEPPSAG